MKKTRKRTKEKRENETRKRGAKKAKRKKIKLVRKVLDLLADNAPVGPVRGDYGGGLRDVPWHRESGVQRHFDFL